MAMTYLTRLKPEAKGVYSASTAYEANSLVTSTDGARVYLCVKDAPAGTPLTDSNYFVIHTDLSAARESALDAADVALAARNEMLEIARGLTDAVEASGNPVQKQLAGGIPFDTVETTLAPVQAGSGDASPDNIRAITGWTGATLTRCGKNLLKTAGATKTVNGITFTVNADGSVTANGTATDVTVYQFDSTKGIPVGSYILSGCPAGGGGSTYSVRLRVYTKADKTTYDDFDDSGNGGTVNKSAGYDVVHSVIIRKGYEAKELRFYPMLRLASDTDDTYEPYSGDNYTADFGQTIYGGTVNWQTGTVTVDTGLMSFDGTENWAYHASSDFFYRSLAVYARSDKDELISSHYPQQNFETDKGGVAIVSTGSAFNQLRFYGTGYSDAETWKSYLAAQYNAGTPVQVAYRLAEPTTLQLTPQEIKQLNGTNTLCGDGTIWIQGRERPGQNDA